MVTVVAVLTYALIHIQGSGNNGSSEQHQEDEVNEGDAPLSTSRSER
jgi:hypothetical protein